MTQFSTSESGLFSAGEYNEPSATLRVTFRTSGMTYEISGVDKDLGQQFMTQAGKSDLWVRVLKPMGAVRV